MRRANTTSTISTGSERKAYVTPVDTDYYTQALLAVTLKPLETFAAAPVPAAERAHGEVMVSTIATLYKKLAPRDAREPGLGQDPPARDRAPHDVLLGGAGHRLRLMAT